MTFTNKIVSAVRDAFNYAVHQESTADRARKAAVAEQLIDFSKSVITGSGDYDDRLRKTLLKTRTKYLDTLLEKKVAVSLDERLATQRVDRKAIETNADARQLGHPADIVCLAGAYYPGAEGGGLVSLWDNGKGPDRPTLFRNSNLLEDLAGKLQAGAAPTENIYAYTVLIAIAGEGMVAISPNTTWNDKQVSPSHVTGSKEMETPPAKPAAPPKVA